MLEVKDLTKRFGGVAALDGVNLKVEKGELVGIIGPNGAGKTTFYNCITGFYPPTSGKVVFDGRDVTGLPNHKICKLGMARTFQIPRPFASMTLLENVVIGALGVGMSLRKAREKAEEVVDLLKLKEQANQPISKLNFNYRRRCELARAPATSPKLLMLDETFAGLNPAEIDEMVRLVKDVHESGVTIILTEHVMRVVMSLSERIVVLHQGRVIADGLPKEIVCDSRVVEAYLGQKIFV